MARVSPALLRPRRPAPQRAAFRAAPVRAVLESAVTMDDPRLRKDDAGSSNGNGGGHCG